VQQGIANPSLFNQQVPNPYYGVPAIPQSSKYGSNPTISRITLLLPLSQFCDLVGPYNDPLGRQAYNGLEVKLNKRLSGGLNFQLSYTYSKTMGATGYQNGWPYQDQSLKYEIVGSDRTHILTVNGEYALPFGKGRKFPFGRWRRGGRNRRRMERQLDRLRSNRHPDRPKYRLLLRLQSQLHARWRTEAEQLSL